MHITILELAAAFGIESLIITVAMIISGIAMMRITDRFDRVDNKLDFLADDLKVALNQNDSEQTGTNSTTSELARS